MIRQPEARDLAALSGNGPEQLADWLEVGLRAYLFENQGSAAFGSVARFIDQPEGTISTDIGTILLAMPARDRPSSREACALLLQRLSFSAAQDIVLALCAFEVGYQIGALDIMRVMARKAPIIPDNAAGERLFTTAFDAAVDSAYLAPEPVLACLRALIHHPLFPPTWIGRALIGMTSAAPENFRDHYIRLKPRLDEIYGICDLIDGMPGLRKQTKRTRNDTKRARIVLLRQIGRLVSNDVDFCYPLSPKLGGAGLANWWDEALQAEELQDLRMRVHAHVRPGRPPEARLNSSYCGDVQIYDDGGRRIDPKIGGAWLAPPRFE